MDFYIINIFISYILYRIVVCKLLYIMDFKEFSCLCRGETEHLADQGFGNLTLDDEQYLAKIRETYISARDMYSAVKHKHFC